LLATWQYLLLMDVDSPIRMFIHYKIIGFEPEPIPIFAGKTAILG
jgi:hypothetical protein